jgi:hypothetical protein
MDPEFSETAIQTPMEDHAQQPKGQHDKATTTTNAWNQIGVWLFVVFVIALLLRVVRLDSGSANLNPDETDNLITYLLAKYTGFPTPVGFNWNGAPALNAYLIGWGWELSGQSMDGVRTTTAFLTAASCSLFFFLFYLVSQKRALAAGLTLLLTTNPWFLNFSRSGWENGWNTLTVLLIVLGFYELHERKKTRRAICLLIIGAVAGFYFYHPGKLFGAAVFVLLLLGQFVPAYRVSPKVVGIFALGFGLLILPQLGPLLCTNIAVHHQLPFVQKVLVPPCAIINQELLLMPQDKKLPIKIQKDGWHRVNKVSVLAQEEPFQLLQESIKKNLRGFLRFAREDFSAPLNKRYIPAESPPLPPLLAALYIVGLVVATMKFPYIALFYLLVLLPVEVMSMRTPDAARAVHIVPLIFFFAGVSTNGILEISKRYSQTLLRVLYPLMMGGIIVLATHQGLIYWRWIHSPEVLKAREPAIAGWQYRGWLQTITERIQATDGKVPSTVSTSPGATTK